MPVARREFSLLAVAIFGGDGRCDAHHRSAQPVSLSFQDRGPKGHVEENHSKKLPESQVLTLGDGMHGWGEPGHESVTVRGAHPWSAGKKPREPTLVN
jgi:hypothetical protein